MGKAILSYTLNKKSRSDADEIILMSGTLRSIDNTTRMYESTSAMRQSPEFKEIIDNFVKRNENYIRNFNDGFEGEFAVSFIVDSDSREFLPILVNDRKPIRTRTSSLEEVKSEVEKARKLLFRSKDKLFLKRMLSDERFSDTLGFDIKLKLPEYREAIKKGFQPKLVDGEYYLSISDILQYAIEADSLGLMRSLVEDSLEVWKENILALSDELLYYYSRHLRLALNAYDHDKVQKKLITNLQSSIPNMIGALENGELKVIRYGRVENRRGMSKTKRIEESFAA